MSQPQGKKDSPGRLESKGRYYKDTKSEIKVLFLKTD